MTFPSRTDLVTAMRNPDVSFKAPELLGGEVIQKGSRIIQYSGGYTAVFPFTTAEGKKVAVRCWIADIGDAKKRCQEVSRHLHTLNSAYFCTFKYLDDALLVNGTTYPVVLMDWVDGKPMKEYINDNFGSAESILPGIADSFKMMVEYFHRQGLAHGDLQHGNILIKDDGSLVVIDYDSMFIAPLDGMTDLIKGLSGYQHPARNQNKFINHKLDYFSELVIYLSLITFANYPTFWSKYYGTEDLLFCKDDFCNPDSSELIKTLSGSSNRTIQSLTQRLKEELKKADVGDLKPLEDLAVDVLEFTKEDIFKKWELMPNLSSNKEFQIPNILDITSKF